MKLSLRLFSYVLIFILIIQGNDILGKGNITDKSFLESKLKFNFEHYTTEDGLSQNAVYAIIQDKKGFMWFGTQGGLSRFNGHEFKIFSHSAFDTSSIRHSYINNIYEDSKERIWICTEEGLSLYNPLNEDFTNFVHDKNNSNSICDNFVWTIFEDNEGTIWVGTKNGLSIFDPNNKSFRKVDFSSFVANPDIPFNAYKVFQDRNGIIWICSRGNGLFSIDKENKQNKDNNILHIKYYKIGNNDVRSIIEDSNGNIIVGTFGTGLYKLAVNKNEFLKYNFELSKLNLKHSEKVVTLFIHPLYPEILWIGTEEDGLILSDTKRNKSINIINDPLISKSLSGNMVYSIYKDQSGLIWIGSNQGINLLNLRTNNFQLIEREKENIPGLSSNTIGKIIEDKKGNLWIGTDGGGVNKLDRQKNIFTHYRYEMGNPSSLTSDRAMIVFEDSKGGIWVGTYGGGLNKFNTVKNEFEPVNKNNSNGSICSDYITSIVEDRFGYFWIGTTTGGVVRYDPVKNESKCFLNNPNDPMSISDNHVWILFIDKNNVLWAGTKNGGLNEMIDMDKGIFKRYLHYDNYEMGINNNTVFAIFEDSNSDLWIGTNGGLNKLNRKTGMFTNSSGKGMPLQSGIAGILEDGKKQLWLLGGDAIIRFNPKSNEIKIYDKDNGMNVKDLRIWSCYKNKAGEMFFGGANGFTIFHPDSLNDNDYIPPIVIDKMERFNIDNNSGYAINEPGITYQNNIDLTYKDNIFSLSFAALNYINPAKNKYAYKLVGFNKDWINIGTQNKVTFTNIDAGSYTFIVKGSNDDGIWNETGTSLKINISPPFWKTWWFRTAMILILGITIGTSIRNKLKEVDRHHKEQEAFARQLIETEELERQRIANELHDSLGQNLLVIKNSLLVKQQQKSIDGNSLTETSELVTNAIQEVRSISHNLRPHLLDHLGLTKTIKSLAKQITESSNIIINVEVDNLKNVLETKAEINLFRIIQECLNNIVKHSEASKADIIIKRLPTYLSILIKDYGKGMNLEKIKENENFGQGFGLYGMDKRAHVFNWTFEINSKQKMGTEIKMTIPLKRIS